MRPRTRRTAATAAKLIVALAVGLLVLGVPTAAASPASEQQQGAQILSGVHGSGSLPMYRWMASMMGTYRGSMPYAGMMSRYLRGQGGRNGAYPMVGGAGMMGGYGIQSTSSSGGWPTGAIVLVAVLGGLLLAGTLALALPKLRRHHAGTPAEGQT